MEDQFFLILEFDSEEARDKFLFKKVPDKIKVHFSENTGGYYNQNKWVNIN